MSSIGSVTAWIAQLNAGEDTALAKLHARYWPFLVGLAPKRLLGVPGRATDEENEARRAPAAARREKSLFFPAFPAIVAGKSQSLETPENP
jgi:hypothetical protein